MKKIAYLVEFISINDSDENNRTVFLAVYKEKESGKFFAIQNSYVATCLNPSDTVPSLYGNGQLDLQDSK